MSYAVQHNDRFDAQGKLDADDWLLIPRADVSTAFALDAALTQVLVRTFLDTVAQSSIIPVQIVQDTRSVQLRVPLGKTAMIFAEPECIVDTQRAEMSWRIAGGFLLAHRVNYGGRFYLGAEWQNDSLKLYAAVRRYPPRLVNYFGIARGAAVYYRTQGRTHKTIQGKFLRRVATQVTLR